MMSKANISLTAASSLALALALVGTLGCAPEAPAQPSYAKDVKPILMARCVRCHDETLRGEVLPDGGMGLGLPSLCHLNRLEGTGDCSTAGITAGNCSFGASLCANLPGLGSYIATYTFPSDGSTPLMPPAPAPKLNSYEEDVLRAWITQLDANGAPRP